MKLSKAEASPTDARTRYMRAMFVPELPVYRSRKEILNAIAVRLFEFTRIFYNDNPTKHIS